ncbi:acyl carrier protein [uncultured Campylobacter sp.]|uniref:acyl carrier protein n=1 Tax=uncultured Campylobacter sp. TaxID=218934 RepID=UPI002601E975|nr:acyl carrier protein [uncultured Campylobacter sp.]
MSKDEIFEILKKALVELFEIDESKVVPEAKIYEDLQIDSIDAIDLVDYVKKNTGYKLMPDDFKNIQTLGDIVDAVTAKLNQGASGETTDGES